MSKLQDTLASLLKRARANPGTPVRHELRGGLRIDLLLSSGSPLMRLQLSRPGMTGPSEKELTTVLNHWPGTSLVVHSPPRAFRYAGRAYLITSFPLETSQ